MLILRNIVFFIAGKVETSTFSVARTSSLSTGSVILPFEVDVIGSSYNFNFNTHQFTVPKTGYYWIHISAGIPAETEADIRLSSAYQQQDIVRAHIYATGIDTTSRDGIGFFNEGIINIIFHGEEQL